MTWRLTNAASPTGPNFRSEREQAIAGPQGAPRARRPSVLDADVAPSELLAASDTGAMVGAPPTTRARARTNSSVTGAASVVNGVNGQDPVEAQNARALEVLDRVSQKLSGRDFKQEEELDIVSQVSKLITEATKLENLCQHYIGWCSFW